MAREAVPVDPSLVRRLIDEVSSFSGADAEFAKRAVITSQKIEWSWRVAWTPHNRDWQQVAPEVVDAFQSWANRLSQIDSSEAAVIGDRARLLETVLEMDLATAPDQFDPAVLLSVVITQTIGQVSDGDVILAVGPPWLAILDEIERDPNFLFHFARQPRRFEEFIAAAYERAGFDEVILTPQRGDHGRDLIATRRGALSIRVLDQTKAYSPQNLVTHDDVRAMLGVLTAESNASKGVITTTSKFQPGIRGNEKLKPFLPFRLELRDGEELIGWLKGLR